MRPSKILFFLFIVFYTPNLLSQPDTTTVFSCFKRTSKLLKLPPINGKSNINYRFSFKDELVLDFRLKKQIPLIRKKEKVTLKATAYVRTIINGAKGRKPIVYSSYIANPTS